MFDLNFISDPGMQNEHSDANWSFLNNNNEPAKNSKSNAMQPQTTFIQQNNWKNYFVVLVMLGFIAVISIVNNHSTKVQPDFVVFNKVIDLIDECDYINTLHLVEANFSRDQVQVTIYSEEFSAIQSLSQSYRMENDISYKMYQKEKNSYINLIFPWKGNAKGGDITILESMANKTVFFNRLSINHTDDIFSIQGVSSDIISFLLQMAEQQQLQKFNFSIFQHDAGQFKLIVQLYLV